MRDAIGMIKHLQPRLAPRAELSLVDGMPRIAFEFFGQAHLDQALLAVTHHFCFALHNPHQQTATRGA